MARFVDGIPFTTARLRPAAATAGSGLRALGLQGEARLEFLQTLTENAVHDLALSGFEMLDIKPAHVILRRRRDGGLLRHHNGRLAYALVDYELLTERPLA